MKEKEKANKGTSGKGNYQYGKGGNSDSSNWRAPNQNSNKGSNSGKPGSKKGKGGKGLQAYYVENPEDYNDEYYEEEYYWSNENEVNGYVGQVNGNKQPGEEHPDNKPDKTTSNDKSQINKNEGWPPAEGNATGWRSKETAKYHQIHNENPGTEGFQGNRNSSWGSNSNIINSIEREHFTQLQGLENGSDKMVVL